MRNAIILSLLLPLLMTGALAIGDAEESEEGVPYLIAFLAGVISVLSPCSVPLLFGYLAVISKSGKGFWRKTLSFFAGLSLVWILLGFGAAGLGSFISGNSELFHSLAGGIILLFGVSYLLGLKLPAINVSRKVDMTSVGMFVFGALFTLAWIPCVGPILGGILMIASSGSAVRASILLLVYALGFMASLVTIFIVIQKTGKKVHLNKGVRIFGKELPSYNLVGGIFLIAIGLVFLLGEIDWLSRMMSPVADIGFALERVILNNPVIAGFLAVSILSAGLIIAHKKRAKRARP